MTQRWKKIPLIWSVTICHHHIAFFFELNSVEKCAKVGTTIGNNREREGREDGRENKRELQNVGPWIGWDESHLMLMCDAWEHTKKKKKKCLHFSTDSLSLSFSPSTFHAHFFSLCSTFIFRLQLRMKEMNCDAWGKFSCSYQGHDKNWAGLGLEGDGMGGSTKQQKIKPLDMDGRSKQE